MRIKWRFSKQCGKRRFASLLDAQLALVRAMRKRYDTPSIKTEIRHYLCPTCRGYHLTSLPVQP